MSTYSNRLQASKFIRQKQYYDNINTKCKQYNGRLLEGNPSIEPALQTYYNVFACSARDRYARRIYWRTFRE